MNHKNMLLIMALFNTNIFNTFEYFMYLLLKRIRPYIVIKVNIHNQFYYNFILAYFLR